MDGTGLQTVIREALSNTVALGQRPATATARWAGDHSVCVQGFRGVSTRPGVDPPAGAKEGSLKPGVQHRASVPVCRTVMLFWRAWVATGPKLWTLGPRLPFPLLPAS